MYNLLKGGEIKICEKLYTGIEKYRKKFIEGVKGKKKILNIWYGWYYKLARIPFN